MDGITQTDVFIMLAAAVAVGALAVAVALGLISIFVTVPAWVWLAGLAAGGASIPATSYATETDASANELAHSEPSEHEADSVRPSALMNARCWRYTAGPIKSTRHHFTCWHLPLLKKLLDTNSDVFAEALEKNPIADALDGMHPHFWVGVLVASSSQEIDSFLEEEVPYGGGVGRAETKEFRAIVADNEFRKRNCHLLR